MTPTATSRRPSRSAPKRPDARRRRFTTAFTVVMAWLMILGGAVAPSVAHAALEPTRNAVVAVTDGGVKDRGEASGRAGVVLGCAGHCAMHAWSLPAEPSATLPASFAAARWPGSEIAGAVVRRPLALERPPRV